MSTTEIIYVTISKSKLLTSVWGFLGASAHRSFKLEPFWIGQRGGKKETHLVIQRTRSQLHFVGCWTFLYFCKYYWALFWDAVKFPHSILILFLYLSFVWQTRTTCGLKFILPYYGQNDPKLHDLWGFPAWHLEIGTIAFLVWALTIVASGPLGWFFPHIHVLISIVLYTLG